MKKFLMLLLLFLSIFSNQVFSQICPSSAVVLNTQQEVDDFSSVYPGCSEIPASLTVTEVNGSAITNLDGLSQIITIQGNLKLEELSVQNFNGLQNLTNITGDLIIEDNDLINDLAGLGNLISLGDELKVELNDNLIDFVGLSGLTSIPGDLTVRHNPSLTNFEGLNNLQNILGGTKIELNEDLLNFQGLASLTSAGTTNLDRFRVELNNSLVNFSGLENLTEIAALWINGNTSLENFSGLNNLAEITDGGLNIWGTTLSDLSGLSSLNYINGLVDLSGNGGLNSLQGLHNVTFMGGINVRSCPVLEDFSGLNSLHTLGNIYVDSSPQLRSFNGLQNVTEFNNGGINVTFNNNSNFESLSGIDFIDYTTIDYIQITNVPSLTDCAVRSVCDFILLGDPTGSSINQNGPGCQGFKEIIALCKLLSNENFNSSNFILNPNPTKDHFTIYGNQEITKLSIYNTSGKLVKEFEESPSFDVSDLTPGVYFLKIESNQGKEVIKLIKE